MAESHSDAGRVLAYVVEYPGDWTASEVAEDLGLCRDATRRAVHALARDGLLAPRAYRLHACVDRSGDVGQLVRPSYLRSDGLETARAIVRALHSGPLTAAQLAHRLDVSALQGSHKRLVRALDRLAFVSPPTRLWPTADGVALVESWRVGVGECAA